MREKTKLRVNDPVKVIAGKEKGKTGKIAKIDHQKGLVIVQGLNMVKKTKKPRSEQDKGGIQEIEAPINISNVAYMMKNATTRLGFRPGKDGKKVRYARKTGDEI